MNNNLIRQTIEYIENELERLSPNSTWRFFISTFPSVYLETFFKSNNLNNNVLIFQYLESDIKLENIVEVLKSVLFENEFKYLSENLLS